jgi:hypothetical protein
MNSDPLIINLPDVLSRSDKLFRDIEQSTAGREAFLRDPVGTLSRILFPDRPEGTAARIESANHFLFALLTNRRFMDWMEEYKRDNVKRIPELRQASEATDPATAIRLFTHALNRADLYRDVVEGIFKCLDLESLNSLLALSGDGGSLRADAGQCRPEVRVDSDTANRTIRLSLSLEGGEGPKGLSPVARPPVVVFVVAIAVAVVVYAAFWFDGEHRIPEGLTREDLLRITKTLSEQLSYRAEQMRSEGKLSGRRELDVIVDNSTPGGQR